MNTSLAHWISQHSALLATEQARRHAVLIALSLTEHRPLAPMQHERLLLEQFIRGELTLSQVLAKLESSEPAFGHPANLPFGWP